MTRGYAGKAHSNRTTDLRTSIHPPSSTANPIKARPKRAQSRQAAHHPLLRKSERSHHPKHQGYLKGLSLLVMGLIFWGELRPPTGHSPLNPVIQPAAKPPSGSPLGPRQQLSYEEWLDLLAQEAQTTAELQPNNLAIVLGDSLSLWLPSQGLPPRFTWLNQGLSGDTLEGLRRRIGAIASTQPRLILVMAGANDLLKQRGDDEILQQYEQLLIELRAQHPEAKIVVQSILPHGSARLIREQRGQRSAPEWAERLIAIPNQRIRDLNQQLQTMTLALDGQYLDLHSVFCDEAGDLRDDLSSDGLHLSPAGYTLWQSQLALPLHRLP
jgi:lysophospholipase L1-like esterase